MSYRYDNYQDPRRHHHGRPPGPPWHPGPPGPPPPPWRPGPPGPPPPPWHPGPPGPPPPPWIPGPPGPHCCPGRNPWGW